MKHVVTTPAGRLELVCKVHGFQLELESDLEEARGVATAIERWSAPGRLDVSIVRATINPPFGQERGRIDGYLAVVWSLDAHAPCGPITIEAHFTDVAAYAHLSGNSGEWLEAVDYAMDEYGVTIGTHDDEALLARASRDSEGRLGPALPSSWAPRLTVPGQGEFGSRVEPLGLGIHLPPLAPSEHADIHVAVAWGPDDGHGVAAWFAVDTNPTQILRAVATGQTAGGHGSPDN